MLELLIALGPPLSIPWYSKPAKNFRIFTCFQYVLPYIDLGTGVTGKLHKICKTEPFCHAYASIIACRVKSGFESVPKMLEFTQKFSRQVSVIPKNHYIFLISMGCLCGPVKGSIYQRCTINNGKFVVHGIERSIGSHWNSCILQSLGICSANVGLTIIGDDANTNPSFVLSNQDIHQGIQGQREDSNIDRITSHFQFMMNDLSVITIDWRKEQGCNSSFKTSGRCEFTLLFDKLFPQTIKLTGKVFTEVVVLADDHILVASFHCSVCPIQRTAHQGAAINHHELVMHMHLLIWIHTKLDACFFQHLHTGILVFCLHVICQDSHMYTTLLSIHQSSSQIFVADAEHGNIQRVFSTFNEFDDLRKTGVAFIRKENGLFGFARTRKTRQTTPPTSPSQAVIAATGCTTCDVTCPTGITSIKRHFLAQFFGQLLTHVRNFVEICRLLKRSKLLTMMHNLGGHAPSHSKVCQVFDGGSVDVQTSIAFWDLGWFFALATKVAQVATHCVRSLAQATRKWSEAGNNLSK